MNFQKELRKAKATIREWVRSKFSDQHLASVAAFNADGKMSFANPCSCLLGVTYSSCLHYDTDCDGEHYRLARWDDLAQSGWLASLISGSGMGKVEKAYVFLGFGPDFGCCFGDDGVRGRRFGAMLRAEMRRRDVGRSSLNSLEDLKVGEGYGIIGWHEEDVECG
jgi:hypothetical protein